MCVFLFSCCRHAPTTAFSLPQGVSGLGPFIATPLFYSLKELYSSVVLPFNLLV